MRVESRGRLVEEQEIRLVHQRTRHGEALPLAARQLAHPAPPLRIQPDEAEALCDRVGIVDQGRLIALGTPRELVSRLGADHVIEFALAAGEAAPPEERLRALPGVGEVRSANGTISLIADNTHATIPALLAALGDRASALTHLATRHATLEDLFVALTGRHLRDD